MDDTEDAKAYQDELNAILGQQRMKKTYISRIRQPRKSSMFCFIGKTNLFIIIFNRERSILCLFKSLLLMSCLMYLQRRPKNPRSWIFQMCQQKHQSLPMPKSHQLNLPQRQKRVNQAAEKAGRVSD